MKSPARERRPIHHSPMFWIGLVLCLAAIAIYRVVGRPVLAALGRALSPRRSRTTFRTLTTQPVDKPVDRLWKTC